MGDVCFGLELEGIFYDPSKTLQVDGYHSGRFDGNNFKFESDSSLTVDKINKDTHTGAECICKYFRHSQFPKVYVQRLKEYFSEMLYGFRMSNELNECVYFNESCGLHVHFSVPEQNLLGTVYYDFVKLLRTTFFDMLDDSVHISELVKRIIKERYYRGYAEKLHKDDFYGGHGDEINFQSYESGTGLEWRSPCACGIRTWDEFEELIEILCNSIITALNGRQREYTEIYKCAISMQ